MSKIVLKFHSNQHKKKREELLNRVSQLNECLNLVKLITEGEITELNFDKLCAYLNNKTGFKNAKMSANAMGVNSEFEFIERITFNKTKDDDFIEFKKGKYCFDDDVLTEVFTDYLSADYVKEYERLQKLAKALNDVPKPLRRLFILHADNVRIDKDSFNTIMQMMSRG